MAAFAASRAELKPLDLPEAALNYLSAPDWRLVDQDLAWLERPGNHLLSLDDPCYPPLLRHVPYPPPLLFVCGPRPVCGSRNSPLSAAAIPPRWAGKPRTISPRTWLLPG